MNARGASEVSEAARARFIDRAKRITWPYVMDYLEAQIWNGFGDQWPQIGISIPRAFELHDLTAEDVERLRAAVSRAYARELKKVWTRHVEQHADEHAASVAAMVRPSPPIPPS